MWPSKPGLDSQYPHFFTLKICRGERQSKARPVCINIKMNRKREIVDGEGERSAYDKEKVRRLLSSLLFGLDQEHVSVQEVVDKMEQ